jgi:hypothetical protein
LEKQDCEFEFETTENAKTLSPLNCKQSIALARLLPHFEVPEGNLQSKLFTSIVTAAGENIDLSKGAQIEQATQWIRPRIR